MLIHLKKYSKKIAPTKTTKRFRVRIVKAAATINLIFPEVIAAVGFANSGGDHEKVK
jgi:hypothetical protein